MIQILQKVEKNCVRPCSGQPFNSMNWGGQFAMTGEGQSHRRIRNPFMHIEGFQVLQALSRYQAGNTASENHGIRHKEKGLE